MSISRKLQWESRDKALVEASISQNTNEISKKQNKIYITVGKQNADFIVTDVNFHTIVNQVLVEARNKNQNVRILSDTYTFRGAIQPVNNTTLICDDCTFINHSTFGYHYFVYNVSTETTRNFVKNFVIKGNNAIINNNDVIRAGGISLNDCEYSTIEGFEFINCIGSWFIRLGTEPSSGATGMPSVGNLEGSYSPLVFNNNVIKNITLGRHASSLEMLLVYNQKNLLIENVKVKDKKTLANFGYIAANDPNPNKVIDGNRPLIGMWQKCNDTIIRNIEIENCENGANGIYYCLSSRNLLIENVKCKNSGNIIFGGIVTDNGRSGTLYAENITLRNIFSEDKGVNKYAYNGVCVGATKNFTVENCYVEGYSSNFVLNNGSVFSELDNGNIIPQFYPRSGVIRDCNFSNSNEEASTFYNLTPGIKIDIGGYQKTSSIPAQNGNFSGGVIDVDIVFDNVKVVDTRATKRMYTPVAIGSWDTTIINLKFIRCTLLSFSGDYPAVRILNSNCILEQFSSVLDACNINNHNYLLRDQTLNPVQKIIVDVNSTNIVNNANEITLFDEPIRLRANSVIEIMATDDITNNVGGGRDVNYRLYITSTNNGVTTNQITTLSYQAPTGITGRRALISALIMNEGVASKYGGNQRFYPLGHFMMTVNNTVLQGSIGFGGLM